MQVMVFGSSNMTHYQLCNAFDSEDARDNYLRIEVSRKTGPSTGFPAVV
jgi:hypothetical protein